MTVSNLDLAKLIKQRKEALELIEKTEQLANTLRTEILAEFARRGIDKFRAQDFFAYAGDRFDLGSFDADRAAEDYPYEKYPFLWSIDVKKLRDFLGRSVRNPRLKQKPLQKYLNRTTRTLTIQRKKRGTNA